ncbi:diflavin flavoprotein [Spirulina subsalsa FACHB-351]|uniref:Diflavin flavoprotein n=1 Tax=Spirulina subsalsa FACHB-351 TaxID=234711 RepID=A0ABT3L2D4_9CYAN|nr:diflavin flavoprotein [Spirulina subsalsa]MCW6035640.1 diflavin flavoprotein [Spirulina subsalsa FACHB-351]
MINNKPRDTQIIPISAETTVIRSRTWDRLKFEIEYALQKGTTANSFIIKAHKTAVIDLPGESFTEIFLKALTQRFSVSEIDYVICGHINPNRAVTLKALLEIAPDVTIICSNPGAISLRKILPDQALNIQVVKGGDTLDLGQGHNLEFILTPSPRWSDQMCTYDPKTQILYTGKLFGAHVCGDQIFDEGWQVYRDDRRYYFDCLMAPHANQVETALEKLANKSAKLYATGHGPLVRYGLTELTGLYKTWVEQQQNQQNRVALIYASAYGNTAIVAQAIARGITKAGVAVDSINCEFTDPEEIKTAVTQSAGFIMGSPTLGGHAPTQVQTALGLVISTADKQQLAGVFGSYGWSGEAIDLLEGKLRDAGYRFGFDPIRVKFKPTDTIIKYCEEVGTDFAQLVKRRQKQKKPKASVSESQSARTEQAVGRIVGSLSVVTTRKGELSNAMLASWVSQASFSPPGLTIAVAKERAIADLMHRGDKFVLNILQEGKQLRKHFMKNFAPGEDRFVGLETETAENGCPILKQALAYLECRVNDRMECGDHWLVYAVVDSGKVLDNEGITAVHHRKTGIYY